IQIVTSTIWLGLGIALIVMGAIYKDDCPIQPYIPIFLLVTGVIHLMAVLIHFLKCVLETCGMVLQGIIGMFGFAWFVVGNIWVFGLYSQNKGLNICDLNLYNFAFGFLIFEYVVAGISFICICCGSVALSTSHLYER
ncbi:hypothetical protein GDO78_014206, partial [Eleutherodactylus coqui]